MYGPWSNHTGNHNALYPSSKQSQWEKSHLNMNAVANNWIKAGINRNKLVLSIAFHSLSFTLKDKNQHSTYSPVEGQLVGVLRYSEICSNYTDFTEVWDNDQKSPYKYKDDQWFAYNSKEAVSIKGDYIKSKGFFGVNVWHLEDDDIHGVCGTKQVLLKYLHEGLGNKVNFGN
ncbi:endochitinase-like isoform X1 [Leptinotarsa decemlineata]|uniref:endochitinase-like isoform X1 n=1 Tax=Leptinotarsa decemlineata TaxID=7539 RepID=UPI003D30CCA5